MTTRELDLGPRQRNYYRFSAPVFDFEFRREDQHVVLAFSAERYKNNESRAVRRAESHLEQKP